VETSSMLISACMGWRKFIFFSHFRESEDFSIYNNI
jgi:hypothetical protein